MVYFNPLTTFDPRLGPYNQFPNVVVTGTFPCHSFPPKITNLTDVKSQIFYSGLPRISATPMGMNSLYNRNPWIDESSLQTRRI